MNKHQQRLKEMRRQERIDHKLVYKGAETALGVLMVIPLYVLHTKFGFGNKRLQDFMREFYRLYELVKDDKVRIDTLINSLDAETGLLYNTKNLKLTNRRKKEQ